MEFWEILTRYADSVSISSVYDMEGIQTDLGRVSGDFETVVLAICIDCGFQGRAWIMLSLVQKRLASFVQHLLAKQESLKPLYFPGGFLVSEELTELAGNLRCLDAIDFK